jgi:hypothetical protein
MKCSELLRLLFKDGWVVVSTKEKTKDKSKKIKVDTMLSLCLVTFVFYLFNIQKYGRQEK